MSNHRFIKFWPQDWQNDPALNLCSLAARGLWMSMLCVMHDAEPYGHLTVNGKAATTRHLAVIARTSEKEVLKLAGELEDAGVFSRTEDGTIYSRRMVRDHEVSEEGRRNVGLRRDRNPPGGQPPPNKPHPKPATSPPNSPPTSIAARGATTQESEAYSEAEAEAEVPPKPPASGGRVCDDDFEAFWKRYPRKDDKGHARTAWAQARRKAPASAILAGLERYQFSETPRFQPLPSTWLRGERWLTPPEDDFDPVLRAVGLTPEDFENHEPPKGTLLQ